MASDLSPAATPFAVSARAAKKLVTILAAEPAGSAFRLSVKGGGCSGFSYVFDVSRERLDDDLVVARDGVEVRVDAASLPFLEGAELDFEDALIGSAFKVKNPNATASCGCGTSFAI
ncbi:MAG: iron-sulfur cluster assembly accessory protein [Hyphomicrobiales bacterium]|nr:iron-sulfur cluster assembly accessory protein [Hyphomicrobiales bacterium]MDE2017842.1 iron-sulfur cluster assembly accessory protein [Hyphomicrobiales bacterium]